MAGHKEYLEEIKQDSIKVRYSIRGFFPIILPRLVLAIFLFLIWLKIPESGVKVKQVFNLNTWMPQTLSIVFIYFMAFLNSLSLKNKTPMLIAVLGVVAGGAFLYFTKMDAIISHSHATYGLLSLALIFLLKPIYYTIFALTGYIAANERRIEVNEGVFGRIKDPTDMVSIEDCNKITPFVYRILGISQLVIDIKKTKLPLKIFALDKQDAIDLYNFVNAYAFSSSAEYWTTRDRNRQKAKEQMSKDNKYIEDLTDVDEGFSDDDDEEFEDPEDNIEPKDG